MTSPVTLRTLEQRRAEHAWQAVQKANEEFADQAKRLGPRILTSGLGPAVQFLIAKDSKDLAKDLRDTLDDWLLREGPTRVPQTRTARPGKPGEALIAAIIEGDANRLRHITGEALAYLAWLNRFCEARGLGGEMK
jgi:CRISPR-associated protein Cmr5